MESVHEERALEACARSVCVEGRTILNAPISVDIGALEESRGVLLGHACEALKHERLA